MKNFMSKHDITQTINGKPIYIAVGKVNMDMVPANIDREGLWLDEEFGNIWVYNKMGWSSQQQAVNYAFNMLLVSSMPKETGSFSSMPKPSMTKETVVQEREKNWYFEKEEVKEVEHKPIPKRKVPRKRETQPTTLQRQGERVVCREPANRELMNYYRGCFVPTE